MGKQISPDTKVSIFKGKNVRRVIHNNEWWFSVIDVIEALADSNIPKRYWSDLKIKLKSEGYNEVYDKIVRLKLTAVDRKMRETDCGNTETIFRIIQSIPSPKAEPFKRWLAKMTRTAFLVIPSLTGNPVLEYSGSRI